MKKEILMETKNFYLVPALGSFLPYYFLIISQRHYNSLSQILNNKTIYKEFLGIKGKIQKFIKEKTNSEEYVCFEHGASSDNQSGCCIGHIHLHVLPYNRPLLPKLRFALGEPMQINNYFELNKLDKNNIAYLLVEAKKKIYIWKEKNLISQYMRRMIAGECQISKQYDWRQYPFYQNMNQTIVEWFQWLKK